MRSSFALYIFSESESSIDHILNRTTSGGVAVNAVMEHLHDNLPFGGVGNRVWDRTEVDGDSRSSLIFVL